MGAMKTALDVTLVSLRKVGPVASRIWLNAKEQIASTKAKPLVCNVIVTKVESMFDTLHDMLLSKCIEYRARLLPKELEQLEKQVEQLKKEIEEAKNKNLRPVIATAWQYAKVEMIPPLTSQMFQGSLGNRIENATAGVADKLIGGIEQQLQDMEAARIKAIQEKEAAVKLAAEKAKAIAIKKAEEEKRLAAAAAKKAAAVANQEKVKEATKPAAIKEPPKEPPKAKTEAKGDNKKTQKRVPPKTKTKAKTSRREVKKGSAPKQKKI